MKCIPTEARNFIQRSETSRPQKMPFSHFHKGHELYFLDEGTAKYFVGTEIFVLHTGDLIFIPAGTFHQTSYEKEAAAKRVVFSFDDNFIDDDCKKYLCELSENKYVRLPFEKQAHIREIILKSEREYKHKKQGHTELERLYFNQLLILISRFRLSGKQHFYSPMHKAMQQAAEYISENINEDLSLRALSEHFLMSPSYFSKQFRAVTGIGLNEYIAITRVTAAEKLLANGTLSVTEVAMRCGFNDSNYFASVFKRIKGITPKKYSIIMRGD